MLRLLVQFNTGEDMEWSSRHTGGPSIRYPSLCAMHSVSFPHRVRTMGSAGGMGVLGMRKSGMGFSSLSRGNEWIHGNMENARIAIKERGSMSMVVVGYWMN